MRVARGGSIAAATMVVVGTAIAATAVLIPGRDGTTAILSVLLGVSLVIVGLGVLRGAELARVLARIVAVLAVGLAMLVVVTFVLLEVVAPRGDQSTGWLLPAVAAVVLAFASIIWLDTKAEAFGTEDRVHD